MDKIIVDIVVPYGGHKGGVEDVIYSWTQNLDPDIFDLRIFHMTPGIAYLKDYEKAYFLKEEKDAVDGSYCASGYNLFLEQLGPPDICIACNEPFTTAACRAVIKLHKLDTILFSWIHSEIRKYSETGNGGVSELILADYHLAINSHIKDEILAKDPSATVYTIGNPILHDIPENIPASDDRTLAFVGRFSIEKRVDLILEALYKAKSRWKLNLIGDGDLHKDYVKWIDMLNLKDQVSFLGWQSNPLMSMLDATAMVTASDYEGLMLSAIEALAMGKMIISTPHQSSLEYLRENENGYFFNFDDADGLAGILDDIASGKKPVLSPEKCKESVAAYSKENYFNTLKSILLDAYNKKRTPA